MLFSVNPIITTGTINLAQAKDNITIGGVRVANCSLLTSVTGWDTSGSPICSLSVGSGTVTSIDNGEGIVLNPDPITTTGFVMGANATISARGIVQVANCSASNFVNGWSAGNVPSCATPSGASVVPANSFNLQDRVYFVRTITNVGTTFVDIYLTAFDPENTLINTTNMTGFRIMITMDYVSGAAATESVSFNQTTNNANSLWVFNTTAADCDPCDSDWQTIPSWASNIETLIEPQWKSTTAADDPSFKGYQIWLR